MQWLAVTLGTAGLVIGLVAFAFDGTGMMPGAIFALLAVPIAPAMVVGVLRPDLMDVRGLVVWGVVTFVTIIVYLKTRGRA